MAKKFTCLAVYDLRLVGHRRGVSWTRNQHLQTTTVIISKYATSLHSMRAVHASYDVLYDPPGAAGFFSPSWAVRLHACLLKATTDLFICAALYTQDTLRHQALMPPYLLMTRSTYLLAL